MCTCNIETGVRAREFHVPDFDMFLCSLCADSSSPQISAKLPQRLRRQMSKSWLTKFPREGMLKARPTT